MIGKVAFILGVASAVLLALILVGEMAAGRSPDWDDVMTAFFIGCISIDWLNRLSAQSQS